MDANLLMSWMRACYLCRRDGVFFTEKTLLVLNSSRATLAPDRDPLLEAKSTVSAIIPEGMTKYLQPLDMGVKMVFKGHLQRIQKTRLKRGKT